MEILAVEQTCRQLVESGRAAERSRPRRTRAASLRGRVRRARNQRPGLLMSLATRFRARREWHADHLASGTVQDAERYRDQAAQALNQLRGQLSDKRKASQRDRAKLAQLTGQTRAWRDQADRAAARWKTTCLAVPVTGRRRGRTGRTGRTG